MCEASTSVPPWEADDAFRHALTLISAFKTISRKQDSNVIQEKTVSVLFLHAEWLFSQRYVTIRRYLKANCFNFYAKLGPVAPPQLRFGTTVPGLCRAQIKNMMTLLWYQHSSLNYDSVNHITEQIKTTTHVSTGELCVVFLSSSLHPSSLFSSFSSLWNEGLSVHLGRAWPSGGFTAVHLFVSGVLIHDLEESRHETLKVSHVHTRVSQVLLWADSSGLRFKRQGWRSGLSKPEMCWAWIVF